MTSKLFLAAALLAGVSSAALAADCSPQADEVNAKCFPKLQQAIDVALATDRPLMLPRGNYEGPVVIDYTAHAGSGFELISRGATIYHGLTVQCQADCFYFHQEGTLFVSGQSPDYLVKIGKPDFSDAHNSIKLDHLVVNNGAGPAVQLNYVLNADMFIVADSGNASPGLALEQVQFSSIHGAASARAGTALLIEKGYTFANSLQALDLEESQTCIEVTSPYANHNGFLAAYLNCPVAVATRRGPLNDYAVYGQIGQYGGAVRTRLMFLD